MHGRYCGLAVIMGALLLVGCAYPRPQMRAAVAEPSVPAAYPAAHRMFFADLVAAVAAMGGGNPNFAYHALAGHPIRTQAAPTPLPPKRGSAEPAVHPPPIN